MCPLMKTQFLYKTFGPKRLGTANPVRAFIRIALMLVLWLRRLRAHCQP